MWEFDVIASTHDLLQEGITDAFRSRIVISDTEFTIDEAVLFAAQWGCRDNRMCTGVFLRI